MTWHFDVKIMMSHGYRKLAMYSRCLQKHYSMNNCLISNIWHCGTKIRDLGWVCKYHSCDLLVNRWCFFYVKLLTPPWSPPWLVLRTAPWQFLWLPRMHFTATALWLVKGPNTGKPSCFEYICVVAVDEERSLNFCCCSKIKYVSLK